jgi:uncharacterized protein YbaR (Trm112 family)
MHIELTEMLRCPEEHAEEFLVLSTSEMSGRMVYMGVVGCPVCQREYEIVAGKVYFAGRYSTPPAGVLPPPSAPSASDPQTLQALLDLSGPGGYVVLLGAAARHAVGLAGLMGGIHFIGVNAPRDVEELPVLSLVETETKVPLRQAMARAVVVSAELATPAWLAEARRVLLPGRRLVVESENVALEGMNTLATGHGLCVGEKR